MEEYRVLRIAKILVCWNRVKARCKLIRFADVKYNDMHFCPRHVQLHQFFSVSGRIRLYLDKQEIGVIGKHRTDKILCIRR